MLPVRATCLRFASAAKFEFSQSGLVRRTPRRGLAAKSGLANPAPSLALSVGRIGFNCPKRANDRFCGGQDPPRQKLGCRWLAGDCAVETSQTHPVRAIISYRASGLGRLHLSVRRGAGSGRSRGVGRGRDNPTAIAGSGTTGVRGGIPIVPARLHSRCFQLARETRSAIAPQSQFNQN